MTRRINQPEKGFSLIETMIVVVVVAVLMGIAVMSTLSATQGAKANAAMDAVIAQLRTGRQLALDKRRNVLLTFTSPNEVCLALETLPGEAPAAPIPSVYLNDNVPGGSIFYLYPGLPDTPMGFGNSQAINLAPASGGTAGLSVMFTSSGGLVGTTASSGFNTVGNSNPVNASIFIAVPGKQNTARAVTVLGSTGRVRSYSWTGSAWQEEQ